MRKPLIIAALAIASFVFIAAVIVYQDPSMLGSASSGTSREQICGECAARRSLIASEWGGPSGRETTEEVSSTVLSGKLDSFAAPACDHDWFTTSHSAWFEGGGHAHGTGDADASTVRMLVETDAGTSALIAFAEATGRRPHSVWKTLAKWCQMRIERDPFFDGLPYDEPENRPRIIKWLKQNYSRIERTVEDRSKRRPTKGGGRKGGGSDWLKRIN